ncbi:MAG: hypothetical protein M3N82_02020 [Pseudomonadota bacterium]|nr:hypothetical protein [Pseudomonadota bacterium]
MVTTNFERCRALHWGAAILNELLIEPSAPVDLADLARGIVPALPDRAVIDALGQGAAIKLTSSQAAAIQGARALLEQLAAAGVAVTVGGRDVIEATLRHFPLAYEDNAGFLHWPGAPSPL